MKTVTVERIEDGIRLTLFNGEGNDVKVAIPPSGVGKLISMLTKCGQVDKYTGCLQIEGFEVTAKETIENKMR